MTNSDRKTAKIYAFPGGGLADQRHIHNRSDVAGSHAADPLPRIVFGNAWYHDEAIQNASKPRKS